MVSPDIAVPSLKALHQAEHELVGVVTQPDRPKGRGQFLSAPAVKSAALELGLLVLQPEKLHEPEFLSQLKALEPDFLCVVAYGRILKPELLAIPRIAPINLHFSLLPQYRGASCVAYALMNGNEETGVTTILMDPGLDTGPILIQWSEPILSEDTTASLSHRLATLGSQALAKTVAEVELGHIQAKRQNDAEASFAPLLKKEMGHVDWSKDARDIFNLYRGLSPWPGVFGFLQGRRLVLTRLRPSASMKETRGVPGTLSVDSEDRLWIQCGSGSLEILELKPEGKSILQASDFVRGLHDKRDLILQ